MHIRFEVSDTARAAPPPRGHPPPTRAVLLLGCGIAPADQARLFRPFQQASSATWEQHGGSGLGSGWGGWPPPPGMVGMGCRAAPPPAPSVPLRPDGLPRACGGLCICQELVNLMGGRIGIDPERTKVGVGSCFFVELTLPFVPLGQGSPPLCPFLGVLPMVAAWQLLWLKSELECIQNLPFDST